MKKKNTIHKNYLPNVSIIFPNFNGGQEPIKCLESITTLNYPQNKLEIIVIDNNSTDGSDILIKKKFPKVKLYKQTNTFSFAQNINFGINKSSDQYIFITNNDVTFDKNSLRHLINYSLAHPQVGVLGGKIFSRKNSDQISSAGHQMNKFTGRVYPAAYPEITKQPDWIQGCTMLVKQKVIETIGLFDENFSFFFEDYDFCLRAKHAGFQVIYLPTAYFTHRGSFTTNRNLSQKYFHWYKSKIMLILKHFSLLHILSIMLLQLLVIAPYRALILHDGRFIPFLKALIWHLTNFPLVLNLRQYKYAKIIV